MLQEEDQLLTMQLPLSLWYSTKRTMNTYVRLEKINIYLSPSWMGQWRHRMSPADSNSSQEQVQRPLFSSLFLSNPLKKRFLCLQYCGGSEVEVSAGSQYVPTRISCVKKFPRAKVKISPWTKVKFWGLARTQWLAQRCNNLHLPSGFLQISNILCQKKQVCRLVQIICCF